MFGNLLRTSLGVVTLSSQNMETATFDDTHLRLVHLSPLYLFIYLFLFNPAIHLALSRLLAPAGCYSNTQLKSLSSFKLPHHRCGGEKSAVVVWRCRGLT